MPNFNTLWALDIETVSQGKRADTYTDNAKYSLGNVKDPAKVEAALAAKKDEARRKHGLHWGTGKVISCAVVSVFGDGKFVFSGHDEDIILAEIAAHIIGGKVIGMTSQNFDFPFLVGRYMANNMPVPAILRDRYRCLDVNNFFGWSSQSGQRGKLALYSHGLGIDGKLMDGGSVQELYNDIMAADMKGDKETATALWKKLMDYNLDDAEKVAEMTRRYYGSIEEVK